MQILLTTLAKVEGVLSDSAPEVDAVGFGARSIELRVSFWTLPQIAQVRPTQTLVLIALKQVCKQADIFIPYSIVHSIVTTSSG